MVSVDTSAISDADADEDVVGHATCGVIASPTGPQE